MATCSIKIGLMTALSALQLDGQAKSEHTSIFAGGSPSKSRVAGVVQYSCAVQQTLHVVLACIFPWSNKTLPVLPKVSIA